MLVGAAVTSTLRGVVLVIFCSFGSQPSMTHTAIAKRRTNLGGFLFERVVGRVGLERCVFGLVKRLRLETVLLAGLSTECSGRMGRF